MSSTAWLLIVPVSTHPARRLRRKLAAKEPQKTIPQKTIPLISLRTLIKGIYSSQCNQCHQCYQWYDLPSPINRVEEHLERAFGLGAMLHAEPKHHDLAFALGETYHGSLALQAFGAVRIARDEDVPGAVRVPGNDRALHIRCRSGGLKSNRPVEECGDLLRHSVTDGVICIHVHAQQRPGNVEVGGLHAASTFGSAGQRVAHREIEFFSHSNF